MLKADPPFALHAETGPATGSKVWDIEGYEWADGEYMARRRSYDAIHSPMNIYEVHIGSWRKRDDEVYPNYREVADELADYCRKMRFTHVELMPITEYPVRGLLGLSGRRATSRRPAATARRRTSCTLWTGSTRPASA